MRKSEFLSAELINRLDNLQLKARLVVEGFIVGLHKSPYHGFSVEFSEHRGYEPGDEIRHVDWKLWAKTDRLYIKQFEEETNLRCYLLLDASASMNYADPKRQDSDKNFKNKLEYGRVLSSALAYLMLKQQDAVGLTLFDSKIRKMVPPRSRPSHLNQILLELQRAEGKDDTDVSTVLHVSAETIKKRGLIVLVSDLLDEPDAVISGLKHFRHKGHEVIVFHVLDPSERFLDFRKRTLFRDLETGEEIITDPWQIRGDYSKNIDAFCNELKTRCQNNRIDYVPLTTDQPLEFALFEYFLKRQKMMG